jgi:hypothetical protein
MSKGISRKKAAAARLGCGITHFDQNYVDRGGSPYVPGTNDQVRRVKPVAMGERFLGFFNDELDRLVEELRAWRDSCSHTLPKRAVPPEFHPSRHRKDPNAVANKRMRKAAKEIQAAT